MNFEWYNIQLFQACQYFWDSSQHRHKICAVLTWEVYKSFFNAFAQWMQVCIWICADNQLLTLDHGVLCSFTCDIFCTIYSTVHGNHIEIASFFVCFFTRLLSYADKELINSHAFCSWLVEKHLQTYRQFLLAWKIWLEGKN